MIYIKKNHTQAPVQTALRMIFVHSELGGQRRLFFLRHVRPFTLNMFMVSKVILPSGVYGNYHVQQSRVDYCRGDT